MAYQEINAAPEFQHICSNCGFAITVLEISADMRCNYTDYFTKVHGVVDVVFCRDCWLKFQETVSMEMRTAIARRRAYESQDKEDKAYKSEDHT